MAGDHVIYSRDFVFDSGVILQGGKLDASHSQGVKIKYFK